MEQPHMEVGSERHHFMMYWNVEQYDNGIKYVFCDELEEYIFYPYKGSLKSIPEYCEKKANFEDTRIFLIIKSTGKLVKVACSIVEVNKCIYMEEGTFNKYWKLISENICQGICRRQKHSEIAHASMNEKVDLSLLESPSRDAEITGAFTIAYKGKEIDIGKQRLISKRANAMEDNGIGYIYSKSDRLVHDKTCQLVGKIEYWDFGTAEEIPMDRELCPKCKERIFIRNAIKTDKKRFAWYFRFFEKGKVSETTIEDFLYNKEVKLHMESVDELIVKCKEDMWHIKMTSQGTYKLYHNNYVIVGEDERCITHGFHDQKHYPKHLTGILHYIEGYDWRIHLKDKKDEANTEEDIVTKVVTEEESKVSMSLWNWLKTVLWRIFKKR